MSDLTVYGLASSQPVRSLLFFLKHSNIPYSYHSVSLATNEHLSEAYQKINPFESVPAIVHNDFNLWESAAIIPYLADAYNVDNQWYPKDPKIRGRINAYLHWHHQNMRAPLDGYFFAKHLGPKVFGKPELSEEAEKSFKEGLENWFMTADWLLSDTGFVARTEQATIADVFAYNEVTCALLIPMDLDSHPRIKSWFDSVGSDPVIQELLVGALEILQHYH